MLNNFGLALRNKVLKAQNIQLQKKFSQEEKSDLKNRQSMIVQNKFQDMESRIGGMMNK